MLHNIIKYYKRVSDMALVNLKNEKTFQFRKHLTNHSLLRSVESHYDKITKSEKARKLVKEYMTAMNKMYIVAREEYNIKLKLLKATKDQVLKQKILNDYANKGITGFISKNGSKWNIETYSNMYSRHINNSLLRLQVVEQVQDQGKNKIRISDHGTACNLCKPYEGKVLTLDELEIAKSNGLFHPNCLHICLHFVERIVK